MLIPLGFFGGAAKPEYFILTGTDGGGFWDNPIITDASSNIYYAANTGPNSKLYKFDSKGALIFQRQITAPYNSGIFRGMQQDSSGNLILGGFANDGAGNFGAGIYKVNSTNGTGIVARYLKISNQGYYSSITRDSSDNYYGFGGAGTGGGNTAPIISKYNSSGTLQWQRIGNNSLDQEPGNIQIDSSNNLYTATRFYPGSGDAHQLLRKFDINGNIVWSQYLKNASAASGMRGGRHATDQNGNMYVPGGTYNGSTNIAYLFKFNSSGGLDWLSGFGQNNGDQSYNCALDKDGNIYITGMLNLAQTQGFLVKLNSSGVMQWQRSLIISGIEFYPGGITISADGAINAAWTLNPNTSVPETIITKLPTDGSLTGTYTSGTYTIAYAASSMTSKTLSTTILAGVTGNSNPAYVDAVWSPGNTTSSITFNKKVLP